MRYCYLLWIIFVHIMPACAQKTYMPHAGDLLFQVKGNSDFSDAISNATAWKDSVKFVHVAIVALNTDNEPYIIEASDCRGVTCTAWDEFIASSPMIDGKPGIVAMRVCEDFDADRVVARALEHLGEEYDWSYRPDNGKMYCSELVYESYRKEDGSTLFTARPMNFRDAEGNMPVFWTTLFAKLGESVPEGLPGTNPNDMSKEKVLKEVYRFF